MVETTGNAPVIRFLFTACKAGALLVEPRPHFKILLSFRLLLTIFTFKIAIELLFISTRDMVKHFLAWSPTFVTLEPLFRIFCCLYLY